MRERFNFVGPGLTPKIEASAAHHKAESQRKENIFDKAELEKTPGERAAIELVGDLLREEFLRLDIPEVPVLRLERFHIMSDAWFNENVPFGDDAQYFSRSDKALFNRSRTESVLAHYSLIFHEAIHAASHQKHWVDFEKSRLVTYRVGYRVVNASDAKTEHTHLRGLNEGVVETTNEELFYEYSTEIQKRLGISQGEMEGLQFSYDTPRRVVASICEGLSQFLSVKKIDVWKNIKKGQFTGEMMYLRNIEHAYSKGALRVLGALQVHVEDILNEGEDKSIAPDEVNERVLKYFESYGDEHETLRRQLAKEILGDELYRKYCE